MTESLTECGPDEVGELWVRGPNVMKGYYCKEVETKAVLNSEGWLGWAFVLNLSPFTVSSILLGKVLGCRPKQLSLEWNFVYCLIGLAIVSVGLFFIQFLFD